MNCGLIVSSFDPLLVTGFLSSSLLQANILTESLAGLFTFDNPAAATGVPHRWHLLQCPLSPERPDCRSGQDG